MSVSRVEAVDRREPHVDMRSAVKLDLVVADEMASHVRNAIASAAGIHGRGAGRILISALDEVVELGSPNPAAAPTELPLRS